MALISINGVGLLTPSKYEVSLLDISKAERNAKGNMLIERINTKRKISISYSVLTGSDLSDLLGKLSPTSFSVTYLDPQTNAYRTSSFYCGDRNVGMIDYINGNPRYRDLSFDLIEM